MSALISAATSMFTPRKETEKKKSRDLDGSDDVNANNYEIVRPEKGLPLPEKRARKNAAGGKGALQMEKQFVLGLRRAEINLIIFSNYNSALAELIAAGRERFSKAEIDVWLPIIQRAVGDDTLSWRSVRERHARVYRKESIEQAAGGGRKSKFTPEVEEAAVRISRSYNGEVSATRMHEEALLAAKPPAGLGLMPAGTWWFVMVLEAEVSM